MFTGLVEETGTVRERMRTPAGARLVIGCDAVYEGLAIGDSVAVDGVCLTVVGTRDGAFDVDCVAETLRRTSVSDRQPGDTVNLERAMRLGDRLGGHIVQGHVDGTGVVRAVIPEGEGVLMSVECSDAVRRYVVEKGSITVDGVSLTVASCQPDGFTVALIPHTMQVTTLGPDHLGRRVNLETDVVAKYVEALLRPYIPEGDTP
ncbi:MAG: riboflavin synthase [Thermoleophilia bacterium]|nr:riboflavin synthase [Thermoleophilia bacterium]